MVRGGAVNGDRFGLITVRGRSNLNGRTGEVIDDSQRVRFRCRNPRCGLERLLRESTVVARAAAAHQAGRRQVVLGVDL